MAMRGGPGPVALGLAFGLATVSTGKGRRLVKDVAGKTSGVQGRRALLRFPRLGLPASGLEGLGFGALLADAVAGCAGAAGMAL